MIKAGDRAKGFHYGTLPDDSKNPIFIRKLWDGPQYHEQVNAHNFILEHEGKEGTVLDVDTAMDIFQIEFDDGQKWWYPLGEYLEQQREERLKELGI